MDRVKINEVSTFNWGKMGSEGAGADAVGLVEAPESAGALDQDS